MKSNVIRQMKQKKIIAIIRGVETENILPLAQALYQGGIRLAEITFDQSDTSFVQRTYQQIRLLNEYFRGNMLIGAGTVMSASQVKLAFQAGADYIISPNVDRDVIQKTKELGLVSIPGALTATEIQSAYEYGADYVKLFPAGDIGKEYIKAVLAPLKHIKIIAVGGINSHNLIDYLSLGIHGVGIGSNIVNKELIAKKDFSAITELAFSYTRQIQE